MPRTSRHPSPGTPTRRRPPGHALLGVYLNDHLAGATGGQELARRVARNHRGAPAEEALAHLAEEIAEDRASLLRLMRRLGVRPSRSKVLAARLAERAGRLKPNHALVHRSPLSPLLELEGLSLGVHGKLGLWRTLLGVADPLGLDRSELRTLQERAERQAAVLEEIRLAGPAPFARADPHR
ncbi:hypothetical protein [Streptomyces sp. GSL17-111]|uniref:hypothetical protein n=1 Tax=Streptomyces sp. GSL17-111 TaxID=3121596 RepID=UPI0030F441F5